MPDLEKLIELNPKNKYAEPKLKELKKRDRAFFSAEIKYSLTSPAKSDLMKATE